MLFNPSSYSISQEQINLSSGLNIKVISNVYDLRRQLDFHIHYDFFIAWLGGNNMYREKFFNELNFLPTRP